MAMNTQQEFELNVPKAVVAENVSQPGKDHAYIQLERQTVDKLDSEVNAIMDKIINTKTNSKEMKELTALLQKMGDEEIVKSSKSTDRMLNRPLRGLRSNDANGDSIANDLRDLRNKMTDLDPSQAGKVSVRKMLSIIPFVGKKIYNYSQEFQSSQEQIRAIIKSLKNGQDELIEDNVYIDEERQQLHNQMVRIEQHAYIMKQLDSKIMSLLPQIESVDAIKAEDIKQEILFPIRQRRLDILQHLSVCMQGYMSFQVIKQNNTELIRGVDRAKNTTVAALQTAIVTSEALGTQKMVLKSINAVNEVTDKLIEENSSLLYEQGVQIQKNATQAAVSIQTLEKSFADIFKAMDAIESYRSAALPEMEKTINSLNRTVEKAKNHLTTRREERIGDFAQQVLDQDTLEEINPDEPVSVLKGRKVKPRI